MSNKLEMKFKDKIIYFRIKLKLTLNFIYSIDKEFKYYIIAMKIFIVGSLISMAIYSIGYLI